MPVVVGGKGAAVVQGGAPRDVRSLIRAELESGWTAADIVAGLAADGLPDDAQIGVVDAAGGVGVHNGPALEKRVAVAQGHMLRMA